MVNKAKVQQRLSDANRDRDEGQKAFEASSAERLAFLKTLNPGRLARLREDPELTGSDQQELRNYIANSRQKTVTTREKLRGSPSTVIIFLSGLGIRRVTLLVLAALVSLSFAIAWLRTPPSFRITGDETLLVRSERGRVVNLEVPRGTRLHHDDPDPSAGEHAIQYWVPSIGYQRATLLRSEPRIN